MAKHWWDTGDGSPTHSRIDRTVVLRALAVHLMESAMPMDFTGLSASAITALIESGSLRQSSSIRVQPTHDVLIDWAIGCLLFEESARITDLPLSLPAPARLARGVRLRHGCTRRCQSMRAAGTHY